MICKWKNKKKFERTPVRLFFFFSLGFEGLMIFGLVVELEVYLIVLSLDVTDGKGSVCKVGSWVLGGGGGGGGFVECSISSGPNSLWYCSFRIFLGTENKKISQYKTKLSSNYIYLNSNW